MLKMALLLWILVAGTWPIASSADAPIPEKISALKAVASSD
jgi:hypothetical protein